MLGLAGFLIPIPHTTMKNFYDQLSFVALAQCHF